MNRLLKWPGNRSLRNKLLFLTLLPLLVTAIGIAIMAAYWTNSYSDRQLYMKVSADLAVTDSFLQLVQKEQLATLRQIAGSYRVYPHLRDNNLIRLGRELEQIRQQHQLSFLRFIPRPRLTELTGNSLQQVLPELMQGKSRSGFSVHSPEELQQIRPGLAAQADIQLIETPHAAPTPQIREQRGMVLRALHPVMSAEGEPLGVLDSGLLLNNTTASVDKIRDLVYGAGSLPPGGLGTVTLFLDDVRISTNVPHTLNDAQNGSFSTTRRAIGTRVSDEVKQRVLLAGDTWIDRAFVVNDWYISAYKPIMDFNQRKIGMIYAGFNEAPFTAIYYRSLLEAALMIALIMLVASIVVLNHTRLLLKPLLQIQAVVRAVRDGNMEPRIGPLHSDDELTELARQFDAMLELLEQREREIRHANDLLEATVERRTRSLRRRTEALKQHIRLLKNTRRSLLDKEKLAALGELTAGIAHEINNPAAVILGNIDLISAELQENAEPVQAEIDAIIDQVYRIRSLINNLLQYSRPSRQMDSFESLSINQVVTDTLQLVRHALDKHQAEAVLQCNANASVEVNPQQIQQVLVNLILNAIHALGGPGQIRLITRDWFDDNHQLIGASVQVSDSGSGIAAENLKQIFDPFFTTKKSGSGLGLSVSYGLIRRHGGDISVESTPGAGTCFTVWLPSKAEHNGKSDDKLSGILDRLSSVERTNQRLIAQE
ncbi:sensor histidine kinase [Marinobacterium jannaschii]|uniref:sensor histidine kinase n=1 Tax=Marinobacterium jannaschii TaxID=64970 RepID=UPI000686459F|nr:cache domain-containing protein [Marinobacterium jannaschii]